MLDFFYLLNNNWRVGNKCEEFCSYYRFVGKCYLFEVNEKKLIRIMFVWFKEEKWINVFIINKGWNVL